MARAVIILTFLSLASVNVLANDPISQSRVDAEGLWPVILASRPVWEFGVPSKALCPSRTAPCYPDYAVDPSTFAQHPGAEIQDWPIANGGCKYPAEDGKSAGEY